MNRHRGFRKVLSAAALALFPAMILVAQDTEQELALVTDRPDFTESAIVVPRGTPQFEMGATWVQTGERDELSGAEVLIRWTVAKRIELRFGLPNYISIQDGRTTSGFSDSSIGAKFQLGPIGQNWDLALITATTVPTGSDELSFNSYIPGLILIAGRDISKTWSFGAQVDLAWPELEGDREPVWGGTAVLGAGLSERWGTFVELAIFDLNVIDTSTLLHHGYTYLLRPNMQFDVHGAVGLSDTGPDYLFGFGFSIRP